MVKRLLKIFGKDKDPVFAIRCEEFNSGEIKYTPVVRQGGVFSHWTQIVKINDRYEPLDIYTEFNYTEKDCIEYISGYRDQLNNERSKLIKQVIYKEAV